MCFSRFFFQNKSEGATEKFQEIQGAYRYLREGELAFLNIYLQDYSISAQISVLTVTV